MGNNYLDADVVLLLGYTVLCDTVIHSNCYAYANKVGRAHTNPIPDTLWYQIDFLESEVTKFSANFILDSMYCKDDQDASLSSYM